MILEDWLAPAKQFPCLWINLITFLPTTPVPTYLTHKGACPK